MSELQIMQELTQHQQAVQEYLLQRNRWNGERLYRRCNEQYFRMQALWRAHALMSSVSSELADAYEEALYLQSMVEQEHG